MKFKNELKELKECRKLQNLAGIEDMFCVLEESDNFVIDQNEGCLPKNKIGKKSEKLCTACVFAYLAWYFRIKTKVYDYEDGIKALAEYLGLSVKAMLKIVGKLAGNNVPHGSGEWGTKPSTVFGLLQDEFPNK